MLLGRLKYIQVNLLYPNLVCLMSRWLLKSWKDINNHLLIKFQQNWFKLEEGEWVLMFVNLLILFWIKMNWPQKW